MASWKVKSALRRFIARLPRPHSWNELFQWYVTRSITLNEQRCEAKLVDCRTNLEAYWQHSPSPRGDFTALELGTGWSPVVPIVLALCGAREVWTCDIVALLSWARVR